MFSQSQGAYGTGDDLIEEEQHESELVFDDPVQGVVGRAVEEYTESMEAEVETLNEVQVRMKKAAYYDLLLQNPLFGPHEHPLASEVEQEVRGFVLEQLRAFLGMKPEGGSGRLEQALDDEQVKALAVWANKLLKRPAMFGLQAPQKKVEVPPAVAPQVNMASLQQRPMMAPRQAEVQKPRPQPARQLQPKQPVRRAPPPSDDDDFEIMTHPVTGKPVRVSKQKQAAPSEGGAKPVETPQSGNFISQGAPGMPGGFVDMTGGAASQAVSQAVAMGNVGGMNAGIQGQLVNFFLKNK